MASMVFQLRVVAGTQRCLSTTALEYVWPVRRRLNANLPVMESGGFDWKDSFRRPVHRL